MILGSHNSWSYLQVAKWWMKPIAFIAKCQNMDIRKQYEAGVRCFDLRVRFDNDGNMIVAHGIIEYKDAHVWQDLDFLDKKKDCYVRILHEVRTKKQYTKRSFIGFRRECIMLLYNFKNIKFWCGRNLYDWGKDYDFGEDPTCEELYGSVSKHKWFYGCWPWLYARLHNKKIRRRGTESEILLIDYVDIEPTDYNKVDKVKMLILKTKKRA